MTRPAILNEPEKWVAVPVEPVASIIPEALSELEKHGGASATVWSGKARHRFAKAGIPLYARPDPTALADLVAYAEGLERRLAEAEKVISWYGEQAEAMARHTIIINGKALEAVVTCIALDGGDRALAWKEGK